MNFMDCEAEQPSAFAKAAGSPSCITGVTQQPRVGAKKACFYKRAGNAKFASPIKASPSTSLRTGFDDPGVCNIRVRA